MTKTLKPPLKEVVPDAMGKLMSAWRKYLKRSKRFVSVVVNGLTTTKLSHVMNVLPSVAVYVTPVTSCVKGAQGGESGDVPKGV